MRSYILSVVTHFCALRTWRCTKLIWGPFPEGGRLLLDVCWTSSGRLLDLRTLINQKKDIITSLVTWAMACRTFSSKNKQIAVIVVTSDFLDVFSDVFLDILFDVFYDLFYDVV